MSRYIELDTAIVAAISAVHDQVTAVDIASALEEAPTADVVEVVRCRDCKLNRDNGGDCDRTIILNEYDSTEYRCAGLEYCSYGERKENER